MTSSPRGNRDLRTRLFCDTSCSDTVEQRRGENDQPNVISRDDGKSLAARHDLVNTGDIGLAELNNCLAESSSCAFPSAKPGSKTFEQSLQGFCQTLNPLGTSGTATQTVESPTRILLSNV
ncbi:conserved hypothetical protein [Neospora caninum Liverpool]|uniref:Uncharacterized protein n=1 Tax=Neospora caninum (strain Liverpool) TaxID=572307 RepID=F0VDH9_NEOCL|nr:conserved hypothetical protein [Neospora caninum Liverpool]CBZ51772.1 conserved hypothetical protein [Neospora caninum Liverpool]CEL65729.1 TPA: hypothetical protein BN1204_015640 [Neospora caninum Liverpool]|eukprot:XP_003881805.1 conserved hypothetical protein [Neospora caninum Liverpool]